MLPVTEFPDTYFISVVIQIFFQLWSDSKYQIAKAVFFNKAFTLYFNPLFSFKSEAVLEFTNVKHVKLKSSPAWRGAGSAAVLKYIQWFWNAISQEGFDPKRLWNKFPLVEKI